MKINTISYIPKEELQKIVGGNIRKIAYQKSINLMKLSEEVDMSYEYLRSIVSPNGKNNYHFIQYINFQLHLILV